MNALIQHYGAEKISGRSMVCGGMFFSSPFRLAIASRALCSAEKRLSSITMVQRNFGSIEISIAIYSLQIK